MELYNKKGQVVGKLVDKTYVTRRKPIHFMKMYQGFGLSEEILIKLKAEGCETVRIVYEGVKGILIYESPIEKWIASKLEHTFEEDDLQLFVRKDDMTLIEREIKVGAVI